MKKLTIVMLILDILALIGFGVTYGITKFKNTIIATALNNINLMK